MVKSHSILTTSAIALCSVTSLLQADDLGHLYIGTNLGLNRYTTETGKTVQVAKFVDTYKTEIWLSSGVPFLDASLVCSTQAQKLGLSTFLHSTS